MLYIEAPDPIDGFSPSLFLAGSITGASDWQSEMVALLLDLGITIFNPRRKNFPIDDPSAAREQIKWEYSSFVMADLVSFWFAKETVAPITLFELGVQSATLKDIVIGIEPGYPREQDVRIQMELSRPDVRIVSSIPELAEIVRAYYES